MKRLVEDPATGEQVTIDAAEGTSVVFVGDHEAMERVAVATYPANVPWAVCPEPELLLRYRALWEAWRDREGDAPPYLAAITRVWETRDAMNPANSSEEVSTP